MTTIAITGVGGLVGRRLVEAFQQQDGVRLVGVDLHLPEGLAGRGLTLRVADVRDRAQVAEALQGTDVVVHLASVTDPQRDEAAMRETNVGGTRNVVDVALEAGVGHIVYLSAAIAYGAHPDNPVPIPEDHPLRADPAYGLAALKAECDRWLADVAAEHTDRCVTVLRPATVAGPGVHNFVTRQLESPRMLVVRGHQSPWQFVHVDDLASAVVHVVTQGLGGVFNVAAEGWLSLQEVSAIVGRRFVEVPEEVAFSLADRLWRLGIAEAPAGHVSYLMHPVVLDVTRLVDSGWQPQHSNRDALAALVREHAPYVTLAGVRANRSHLQAGAAVGATGLAALAAWQASRRRRRRRG